MSGAWKSTQPTTPLIQSCSAASRRRKSFSAADWSAWTATHPSMWCAFRIGPRSSGRKSRLMAPISSVIHASRTGSNFQKCWCESIPGIGIQVKYLIHKHPFFAGFRPGEELLKILNKLLPFLHFGICSVHGCFLFKAEFIIDLHDHEQPVPGSVYLHAPHTGIENAFRNLRPELLVPMHIFRNGVGIIFEVEGEAVAGHDVWGIGYIGIKV